MRRTPLTTTPRRQPPGQWRIHESVPGDDPSSYPPSSLPYPLPYPSLPQISPKLNPAKDMGSAVSFPVGAQVERGRQKRIFVHFEAKNHSRLQQVAKQCNTICSKST